MNKNKGLILVSLIIIGLCTACGNNLTNEVNTQSQSQKAKEPSKSEVAYNKFINIAMGSSYDQVKAELGTEGSLTHENSIGNTKTQSYHFTIGDAHISMTFSNGALTNKSIASLAFLNDNNTKINLDQFNKIQSGMSYDQVREIMESDGHLSSQTQLMGHRSSLYTWMGPGASNVVVTFDTNNTVNSKTQFGLK